MLTIACVFTPGGGFTDEYVYRLKHAVMNHYSGPVRFVCLTNEPLKGVELEPLKRGNSGWWNKLELFRKGLFEGPIVYLDLDTIIVGDITDIFDYPHKFTGLSNFKGGSFASGFMAWNGDYSYLDQNIDKATDKEYDAGETGRWQRHGDQGFIADHLKVEPQLTDELFPDRFVSYKWSVRRQGFVPPKASVVCFHGRPRPHDVNWELPSGN